MTPVVLASSSPRRRELLGHLGVDFTVVAPDVDETPMPGEPPVEYVRRVALAKLAAVAAPATALVIAADTTVECDGDILAKPDDADHARAMLRRLSGRTHHCHTAVAVGLAGVARSEVVTTAVTFVDLSDRDITWYVSSGEPMGKAGAYAVQGAGGAFVEHLDGSVSNVIGLPLHALVRLTAALGAPLLAAPSPTFWR